MHSYSSLLACPGFTIIARDADWGPMFRSFEANSLAKQRKGPEDTAKSSTPTVDPSNLGTGSKFVPLLFGLFSKFCTIAWICLVGENLLRSSERRIKIQRDRFQRNLTVFYTRKVS